MVKTQGINDNKLTVQNQTNFGQLSAQLLRDNFQHPAKRACNPLHLQRTDLLILAEKKQKDAEN